MMKRYLTKLGQHCLTKWVHISLVLIVALMFHQDTTEAYLASKIQSHIYQQLTNKAELLTIGGKPIAMAPLREFYEERRYSPLWFSGKSVSVEARFLLRVLQQAESEGLNPHDYMVDEIQKLMQRGYLKLTRVSELELMLTTAFMRYSQHLRRGHFSPHMVDYDWYLRPPRHDAVEMLHTGLAEQTLYADLYAQAPPHIQYLRLRKALANLRALAKQGGWGTIPNGELLKPGMSGQRVALLRQRLKISGDLPRQSPDQSHFDEALKKAVINFQRRQGILADGIVGAESIAILNTPVQQRIDQIIINMERWRWMPRQLGHRYILVNAAGFEMVAIEDEKIALRMRIIVGERKMPTPVFTSRMTHMVINPVWKVPRDIAVNELLPKQQADPVYLSTNKYQVLQGWNSETKIVEPDLIDWEQLNDRNFPYQIHQMPGPNNALGKIKFVMPNSHDIYLHDTKNRALFQNIERDLSHGCIRVEHPQRLMRYLLRGDSSWDKWRINGSFTSTESLQINLAQPIPVYLLYFTAWVDNAGRINFYNDVYQRDKRIYNALDLPYQAQN